VRATFLAAVIALVCLPTGARAQTSACGQGAPSQAWVSACGTIIDNAQTAPAERAKALKSRGVFYIQQRNFPQAIKDFTDAIAIDNKDAEALNDRGLAYQLSGDRDRALLDYDRTIAADPKFVLGYFNRGTVRFARGDAAGAMVDFDQAIALRPDFASAYGRRGILKANRGDPEGAIADETLALQYDPNDVEALSLRGAMLMGKGELDRSIADSDAVLRLQPNSAHAYNNRGAAYTQKGDLARALADYDRAISIVPDMGGQYNNRGVVRFALGQFGPAADDFERAAKADPKNPYPALWRYLAVARTGNASTAEFQNAARAFPPTSWPQPVIDFYLGKIGADAVRAAAAKLETQMPHGKECEAEFYISEFLLAQSAGKIDANQVKPYQPDRALLRMDPEVVKQVKPMLARAAEACPAGFTERVGVLGELKRMQ